MIELIQGRKKRDVYYYDTEKLTITDKEGNVIKIYVCLSDVSEHNRSLFVDNLFHDFYNIQNNFKDVINVVKTLPGDWGHL